MTLNRLLPKIIGFLFKHINKSMNNQQHVSTNKAAYVAAQQAWLDKVAAHCDYALTLQTNLRTNGITAATMRQREDAVRTCLYAFRHKLNRLLTGNGWRRNDRYIPIFVPSIEGTLNTYDKNKTLHIHAALGNLPSTATAELLEDGIRQLWAATAVGTSDIKLKRIEQGTEARWTSYISKEATRGNLDCVDASNIQIPKFILATL